MLNLRHIYSVCQRRNYNNVIERSLRPISSFFFRFWNQAANHSVTQSQYFNRLSRQVSFYKQRRAIKKKKTEAKSSDQLFGNHTSCEIRKRKWLAGSFFQVSFRKK